MKQVTKVPKSSVKNSLSKKRQLAIVGLIILALIVSVLVIYWDPLFELFSNQERLREIIEESGFWGPFIFMALQTLQVVFAPIPGQFVGFAGGFAFGAWLGTLYSLIGTAIGFTLVFLLARRFGRPFVELFVNKKYIQKFDFLVEDRGVLIFFLIFLIPAFPDDIICYFAGLSKIPLKTLIVVALVGRAPSVLLVSLSGAGVADNNMTITVVFLAIAAVFFFAALWQRQRIESFVKSLAGKRH